MGDYARLTPGSHQTRFPALPYTPIWTWTQLLIEHNGNAISFIHPSSLTWPSWSLDLVCFLPPCRHPLMRYRHPLISLMSASALFDLFVSHLFEVTDFLLRLWSRSRHQHFWCYLWITGRCSWPAGELFLSCCLFFSHSIVLAVSLILCFLHPSASFHLFVLQALYVPLWRHRGLDRDIGCE